MKHLRDILIAWGPPGLLLLATLENAGPPTPGGTDWVLLFLAATTPRDAMLCAALATIGSLIGSAIFFEVLRRGGEAMLHKYTSSGRGARFRAWTRHYGLVTVFVSALVPLPILPFKVFVACSAAMGVKRRRFLLVLALARIPRYLALAYLGQQLGQDSWAWLSHHTWQLLALAAALGLGLWAMIRRADRLRLSEELQ